MKPNIERIEKTLAPFVIDQDGRKCMPKEKMLLDAHNEFTQIDRNLTETEIDEIQKVWIRLCKSAGRTECWDPVAQVCVYFDAWEYDGDENPIASLLYQISKEVSSCYRFEGERNYLDIVLGFSCFKKFLFRPFNSFM